MPDAIRIGERVEERKIPDQERRAKVSERNELISNALKERFSELCDRRIPSLSTLASEPASFFLNVCKRLSGISPAEVRNLILYPRGLDFWTTSDIGCCQSLLALSLGERLELHHGERPPVEPFIELLTASRADCERRLQLLSERYSSPLSFTLPNEMEVREYVLMRLMSHDRARIEKGADVNEDDLLLKLNLVAVHAVHVPDLRFLDALNYYYELLPARWPSRTHDDTLMASYFALYAQALAAWM